MYKLFAVFMLSVSLTTSVNANSDTSSNETQKFKELNLIERFINSSLQCPTFPKCVEGEEATMARETELEKEVYIEPSANDDDDKTNK